MIIPEPETLRHIKQQPRQGSTTLHQCGCERIGNQWRLCQFHQGYDDAIDLMRSKEES